MIRWRIICIFFCQIAAIIPGVLAGATSAVGGSPDIQTPMVSRNVLSMTEIIRSWKARQDLVRTVRFSFDDRHSFNRAATNPDPKAITAANDIEIVNTKESISIDGGKVAYSTKPDGGVDSAEVTVAFLTAFNGSVTRRYFGGEVPSGSIAGTKNSPDACNVSIKAVFLAFRPLQFDLSQIPIEQLQIQPQRGMLEGRACAILTEPNRVGASRSVWVDPSRDNAIVRFVESVDGIETIRINITHDRDSMYGWIPAHWDMVWLSSKRQILLESGTYTRTNYAINTPIPPDEFAPAFPPGTWVTDEDKHLQYIVREHSQADRIVTLEESRHAGYQEILATETGMAGLPEHTWLIRWFVFGTGLILVLALLLFVTYRRRQGIGRGRLN
jgi:hypothetical protein